MGSKDKKMFPNGVVYEGVSQEHIRFPGVSGSQDVTVASIDILFNISKYNDRNAFQIILKELDNVVPQA